MLSDTIQQPRMRSASVMTTVARDNPKRVRQEFPLAGAVDRCAHRAIRAAPSQKHTHSGHVPVNSATVVAPFDPEFGEDIGGRARAVAHLSECHSGACDRHHGRGHRTVSARDRSTTGTVKPPAGITPPAAAGLGRTVGGVPEIVCRRFGSWIRNGAPTGATRRSPEPPREQGWASPGTSCSPR